MEKANRLNPPLPTTADVLPAHENEHVFTTVEHKKYRSRIGSLMYLTICTRPKISFDVDVLARQVHAPTIRHLFLVRKILRYAAGTVNYGLTYPCSVLTTARSIRAHCGADRGGCKETRKFTSGWIISIHGTLVIWTTRKKTLTATFSGQA